MKGKTANFSANTWKKLMILSEKQGAVKLQDLAQELGLPPEEAIHFLKQLYPVGLGLDVYYKNEECWLDFHQSSLQYMLPLNPSEWIKIHQMLHETHDPSSAVKSLRKKTSENGPIKVVMELLSQLDLWDQEMNESVQPLIKQLEDAMARKQLVQVKLLDESEISLFAHKIIHLEGALTLVAEDFKDHCLMVAPLKTITHVEEVPSTHAPKASDFEIEDFISAIRAMSERETRLILKIFNHEAVNLFPDYQFLGKPCMVTNPNGDLIWAAYVEPCDALFEWLLSLESHVEILDPVKFKQEYLSYCEEKIKKIA